jgi:hypothetical protein
MEVAGAKRFWYSMSVMVFAGVWLMVQWFGGRCLNWEVHKLFCLVFGG